MNLTGADWVDFCDSHSQDIHGLCDWIINFWTGNIIPPKKGVLLLQQ